ncbi:MAG TPA: SAM-dependent methyltransferase [Usitatibacter sp.]
MSATGRLFLLPAWLSEDTPPEDVVPAPVLERIRSLDSFIVENAKSARAYLAACGHRKPMREIAMAELNEHTAAADIAELLDGVLAGRDTGLLSEAGLPAIADPGALLVAAAHGRGVAVVPCVGPSSILLALMASGLDGQRFRFVGYLPAESAARRERIVELARHSAKHAETQVFIETPYRNEPLLADLLHSCRGSSRLAVAAELTSPREWIRMKTIAGWRKDAAVIGKRPAIFLLLA